MKAAAAVLAAVLAFSGCAYTVPCPIHWEQMGVLLRVKFLDGKEIGIYHCPRGHNFIAPCD